MPEKLDEIHDAVVRRLKGKVNPRTKKPYTESEIWAIAQAQYKKKDADIFFVKAPITRFWEEEVINKSANKSEKSNQRFIEVTVSGLKEDRDNEMMSQSAIDDMIMQFKSGTIGFFPDHGFHEQTGERNVYSWKQMMGVFVDARQENDSLPAVIRLNKAHPDHELFWKYVTEEGMPLGFSIGGKPEEEATFIEIEDNAETEVTKEVENEKKS